MVPPRKNKSIGHNKPPPTTEPSSYDGVTFTKGPMHINHFYEISKCGVNALRLYQYIRTIQGLKYPGTTETSHLPVKVDNKKWEAICKLEAKNIIKVRRGGKGRLPTAWIVLPKKKLN